LNASLELNWRRPGHSQNAAFESPPAHATLQSIKNALPAMNETLTGRTPKDKDVAAKAQASMRVNSESVSNEIDECELQCEKHDEQRI
jgi:hypothetical protein